MDVQLTNLQQQLDTIMSEWSQISAARPYGSYEFENRENPGTSKVCLIQWPVDVHECLLTTFSFCKIMLVPCLCCKRSHYYSDIAVHAHLNTPPFRSLSEQESKQQLLPFNVR
ncbi:hypothetical protein ILYODFUR_003017 [Ilyodon furcidens]|uniref:Uncharacterized protein n=1 Tax=Ilyodon furcidens TaxID=33524 RepID=A0ABV0UZR3_9TELE